jgi:AraC-like DNA-binding protein
MNTAAGTAIADFDDPMHVCAMWSPANIAPFDRVEFVFQRGSGWRARHEGQPSWKARPQGFVYAQSSGVLRFKGRGADAVIGFRVSPVVVSSVLSRPPADFWNDPVALPELSRSKAGVPDCNAQCLFDRALQSVPFDHLDMMSSQLGWSVRGLQRLFAKSAALSPHNAQLFRRHADACALLRGRPDLDIVQIAIQAGFADHEAFTRSFGECIGLTPTHFRRSGAQSIGSGVR